MGFRGAIDLSRFGGTVAGAYVGADWARYLLDGSPSAVRATLAIDGVDYRDRIEPLSRFEQTASDLFLELSFAPPVDLDGGAFPDVSRLAAAARRASRRWVNVRG